MHRKVIEIQQLENDVEAEVEVEVDPIYLIVYVLAGEENVCLYL